MQVVENDVFVDETVVGETRVLVTHRIERLGPERTRITYAAEVSGPGAEELGPLVTADFPEEVLRSLVALAAR